MPTHDPSTIVMAEGKPPVRNVFAWDGKGDRFRHYMGAIKALRGHYDAIFDFADSDSTPQLYLIEQFGWVIQMYTREDWTFEGGDLGTVLAEIMAACDAGRLSCLDGTPMSVSVLIYHVDDVMSYSAEFCAKGSYLKARLSA